LSGVRDEVDREIVSLEATQDASQRRAAM